VADRLPLIFYKVERAEKHIEDLLLACEAFFDSKPYEIEIKVDPDKSERSYHLVRMAEVPDEIMLICGDAIHNLRSALDYLAYCPCNRLTVATPV